MDDAFADRCWAMLALGAPTTRGLDLGGSRVGDFIDRDTSAGKQRSALLVAGLAGLGRISTGAAGQLSQRHGLGLGGRSEWTRMIDGASVRRQAGTVAVLAAIGMQAPGFGSVPALSPVPPDHRAQPQRAGFRRADDRGRGAVANVRRLA